MKESVLISQLKSIRGKWEPGPAYGVQSQSRWQGSDEIRLDSELWRVAQCDSVLEMRQRLSEEFSAPLVMVTPLPTAAIDDDVRARLFRQQLWPVDPWNGLAERFKARDVDRVLRQSTALADAALEALGNSEPPVAASGVLTPELVWQVILKNRLGLKTARPDVHEFLPWVASGGAAAKWEALGDALTGPLGPWLSLSLGDLGGILVRTLADGFGQDALAVGFALGALTGHGADPRALGRLERFTGNQPLTNVQARQWNPSVQHHVVNSLGWRDLRPLQQQSIDPILDGEHCLLLAPTAGGKTEAALLPVLSRMLSEEWAGLSVLYICPIRALLNNLEERLSFYCSLVGRRCGLWHGDVGQAARSGILRDPPDILLTTPESLEAMLISRRTDRKYFFGNLRAVIVDEIHSFAADDRGWHLLAVLERIALLAGRPPQRIGLSATIGNPGEILSWMTRGDERCRIVSPPSTGVAEADVTLDYVGSIENAALVISQLHRGEKRLVFSDSRSQAERLASLLRAAGTNTFVSHSSLSVDERRQAERAFRESRDCVIVATSTLELGIDVGDLDRVLQLEAPTSVASFLQRLGRTGRRSGSRRNCLFLSTHRESLIASAALIRLWRSGYVEPLHPPPDPYPVVAQQIMALIRQEGGASRRFRDSTIQSALAQESSITEDLIAHMLEQGILFEDSGIVGIGPSGERLYGAKNFMALMSVFDTPSLFQVVCGIEELGWVHPLSFAGFGQKPVVISLGGRAWEVIRLDEDRSIAHVRSADAPGRSRWLGGSRALSRTFCNAIRSLLLDDAVDQVWSKRAESELSEARSETFAVRATGRVVETDTHSGRTRWWTFGGLKANYSLALLLRTEDGTVPRFDNFFVEIPNASGLREVEEIVKKLGQRADSSPLVHTDPHGRVKFWACLPAGLRQRFSTSRFTDTSGAFELLTEPRVHLDHPEKAGSEQP